MNRTNVLGWCGAGLLVGVAAACGGDDGNGDGTFVPDAGRFVPDAGTSSGSSGTPGASSGRAPDASSGGSSSGGSEDAGSDDGGSSGASSSGLPPPQCAEGAAPGVDLGVVLELGSPAPSYVTVSEDGLVAAWVAGAPGAIDVHVAARAAVDAAFGVPQVLQGPWADDRVGLGATGLVLAALRENRLGFDAYERATTADPFVVAAQTPFVNLNAEGTDVGAAGQSYGDPMYARGEGFFGYSRYGGGIVDTLRLGSRPIGTSYSGDTPFSSATFLQASGTERRRPVALSADLRTFFYYDEVDDRAYVTSRDDRGEFVTPTSLGARLDARPIAGCGTLVFRDPAAPSQLRAVVYQ